MKEVLNFGSLLPIAIVLIQLFIFLFICLYLFRKFKVIKLPYAGMEYSQAIFAGAILFAVFFVSTALIPAIFQSFKTYQNQPINLLPPMFGKSGQLLLIILFFEILLGVLIYLVSKVLFGIDKGLKEIEEGNIPFSIFISVIIIGCSIVLHLMAKEMMEYITPRYLDFR